MEAPSTSKELSWLLEASYAYQEHSLRRLRIGGQENLARALLRLACALAPLHPAALGGVLSHAFPFSENSRILLYIVYKIDVSGFFYLIFEMLKFSEI